MTTKTCTVSGKEFVITEDDKKFYEKMGVPEPTLCPEERQRQRLAFRNERSLYRRKCDATGKMIVSIYDKDYAGPVYENEYWWSDEWNMFEFGLDIDANASFFAQLQSLLHQAPKMARIQQTGDVNAQYTNCASYNKNCYLLFTANRNEDCSYGKFVIDSKDCFDNLTIARAELCYDCANVGDGYNNIGLIDCEFCSDSVFLKDCVSCKNCFGCVNLRNKQYYFLNEQLTKKEYEKKLLNISTGSYKQYEKLRSDFITFEESFPKKCVRQLQNENCSGDVLCFSQNTYQSYDCEYLEDCKFCNDLQYVKSSYDVSFYGSTKTNELLYECYNCKDCFGCVGLRGRQYCILNKQYTKDECFALKEKIIEQMKKTGEWGEFFPISMSPFGYNETVAQEYYPLTKEEALAKGYKWKDEEPGAKYDGPKYDIPDDIKDVKDDILQVILTCEETGKNYRIVKPELDFYRKMNLPIPRLCPDERHKRRMALRNPLKLWDREFGECSCAIQTTYSPDRPEKILCEECYVKEVN